MLNKLLNRAQGYDIETKVMGITNHLPMALIALERLGATPKRLNEYFEFYVEKLNPLEYFPYDGEFKWLNHLGEKDKFGAYLDFYLSQIYFYGINFTLSTHIEKLLQGCVASAFHALIRLSYGIMQLNSKEVAFGLAHMSSHFLLLPEPLKSDMQPSALIDKALNAFSNYEAVGDSITKRMTDIAEHHGFANVNRYPEDLSLGSFSTLFSQLYLRSNNFTILHTVTSCHAMRVLLPYIQDKNTALKSYWSAALVAVLSINHLSLSGIEVASFKSTDELSFSDAIKSNDDHIIKLVFSCIEEYKYYNEINHLMILKEKLNTNI